MKLIISILTLSNFDGSIINAIDWPQNRNLYGHNEYDKIIKQKRDEIKKIQRAIDFLSSKMLSSKEISAKNLKKQNQSDGAIKK